jgi:hypothetical protein
MLQHSTQWLAIVGSTVQLGMWHLALPRVTGVAVDERCRPLLLFLRHDVAAVSLVQRKEATSCWLCLHP